MDEIDSVTNGEPRGARPQGRTDSVSMRPFGEDGHRDYADARMEVMERNMATIAQTLQELRLNQDQRPVTNHASRGRHLSERAPASRHHHSQDDFVRDHVARERMEILSYEGKQYAGDIFTMQLIPKPYMFVKKLSGNSLKKKQDYRQNITATEYVDAFMAMLCDYRAREPADLFNQMKHLHDVTTDIMSCPWPSIRKCHSLSLMRSRKERWRGGKKRHSVCALPVFLCRHITHRQCRPGGLPRCWNLTLEGGYLLRLQQPFVKLRDRAAVMQQNGNPALQVYQHPNAGHAQQARYKQFPQQIQLSQHPSSQKTSSWHARAEYRFRPHTRVTTPR